MTDLTELGQRKTFGDVFRKEIETLGTAPARPYAAGAPVPSPFGAESVGLALSGGGIRSAAVALGVVQALEAKGAFKGIHYLSTVSGGGYTGASLIAALYRNDGAFPFSTRAGAGWEAGDIADNDAVKALRDRSRYLMPNGLFDLVVSSGILLRGLAVNVVNVATLLFALAAMFLLICPDRETLSGSVVLSLLGRVSADAMAIIQGWFGTDLVGTKIVLAAFLVWLVLFAIYRSFVGTAASASAKLQSDPDSWPARATGGALVVMTLLFCVEAQRPIVGKILEWFGTSALTHETAQKIQLAFVTLAAGTGVVGLTFRFFVGVVQDAEKDATWAAFIKAAMARAVLYISALLLPALIYGLFLWLVLLGLTEQGAPVRAPTFIAANWGVDVVWFILLPLFLIAAVMAIQANLGPIPNCVCSLQWWRRSAFRDEYSWRALLLIIALIVFAVVAKIWVLPQLGSGSENGAPAGKYAAIAAWLGFIAIFFSENGNSLHRLYRDRLQQAFAIDKVVPPPLNPDPLRLSDLQTTRNGQVLKPYPIVNATINLRDSAKNKRGRNADYFVFTPHHIGSDASGYVDTKEFEKAEPHLDLATAVAISGAAVSSNMGRAGVAILTPTLALLNLRLGFWLRNPFYAHSDAAREAASRGDWTLAYIVAEAFGLLNETMKKVYVTDGGHIENLGLHELFKRRCEVIIVSDAEADPAMVFPAFVDAERFARIDLGVRLDLPIERMRENALKRRAANLEDPQTAATSPPDCHAAIGTIAYPATTGARPLPALEGIILYVKSAMTGDERNYLLDYERRNPKFPHEPTSDQFFGEEQFEAYRALGFHAMSNALDLDEGTLRSAQLRLRLLQKLGVPVAQ